MVEGIFPYQKRKRKTDLLEDASLPILKESTCLGTNLKAYNKIKGAPIGTEVLEVFLNKLEGELLNYVLSGEELPPTEKSKNINSLMKNYKMQMRLLSPNFHKFPINDEHSLHKVLPYYVIPIDF